MVGSIGSASNLVNMISVSYQNGAPSSQGTQQAQGAPPPPPPPSDQGAEVSSVQDPLGLFSAVDSDTDNAISSSEYDALLEGIKEVTGNELTSSFEDFDVDGDGALNGAELKSVLDEAGFQPPPPPSSQVAAAYEAQSGQASTGSVDNQDMLAQLVDYLSSRTDDFDVTA